MDWWRSRPLLLLTAALALGSAAAPAWATSLPPAWHLFLVLLLTAVLALSVCWPRLPGELPALPLFFLLGLGLATAALRPALPPHHVAQLPTTIPISLRGRLTDFPRQQDESQTIVLAAAAWHGPAGWQPATGLVQIHEVPLTPELVPGDDVVLRVRLWSHPAAGWPRRHLNLARQGILVQGSVPSGWPLVRLRSRPNEEPVSWRWRLLQAGRRYLAQRPAGLQGLYRALLLGDQRDLTPEQREVFHRTGTSHLLAISGLHLGFLAACSWGAIFWLLRRSAWLLLHLNAYKTALILALGPVWFFAWLTGFSPATQRAACMLTAGVFILLLERPRDFPSLLGLASLIILIWSPLQLFSLSFQLSFLSVAGLYWLYPGISRPGLALAARLEATWPLLAWGERRLTQLLATSLAATLATLPVLLIAFREVPTLGSMANVVLVPLVGFLVLPLGLVGLLLAPLQLGLDRLAFGVTDLALGGGYRLCEFLASLPMTFKLPQPSWGQTMGYYLLLALTVGKVAWRWRLGGLGLSFLLLVSPWWVEVLAFWVSPSLTLRILGNQREMAVEARLPDRTRLVVSAGGHLPPGHTRGPNQELLQWLGHQPYQRVDYLVALTITGGNAGTLLTLAREFPLRRFYYGGDRPRLEAFIDFRNLLGDRRLPVYNLALTPLAQNWAGVQMRSYQLRLQPSARPTGPLILELDFQGCRLLLFPAASREWWARLAALPLPQPMVIVLPADRLLREEVQEVIGRLRPPYGIAVGSPLAEQPTGAGETLWHYTCQGAVVLSIDSQGLHLRFEAP